MRKERISIKVDILIDEELSAEQLIISSSTFSKKVGKIKEYAEQLENTISVKNGNDKILITPNDIFFIESVDKRTFIYMKDSIGECTMRLYELDNLLSRAYFVRVSKSCVVNISYVKSISIMINRNLKLTMVNGEKVIVSRRHVKQLNEMIGLE